MKDKVNVTGVEYYTGESLFYNASDNDPQVLVGDGTIIHISADTKDGKKANMYYSIKEDGKMEEICLLYTSIFLIIFCIRKPNRFTLFIPIFITKCIRITLLFLQIDINLSLIHI